MLGVKILSVIVAESTLKDLLHARNGNRDDNINVDNEKSRKEGGKRLNGLEKRIW